MKSKAHSKKCMDLGVSVGLIDDQDGEEEFGKNLKSFLYCIVVSILSSRFLTLSFPKLLNSCRGKRYRDKNLRS